MNYHHLPDGYEAGEWKQHDGREMPVPAETLVQIKRRTPGRNPRTAPVEAGVLGGWPWPKDDPSYVDIVWYRVVRKKEGA